jgi:hypothetical protein
MPSLKQALEILHHPKITVQEDGIFCFEHNDKVKYAAYR